MLPNTAVRRGWCNGVAGLYRRYWSDGYVAMPQLWIQFYCNLPFCRPAAGQYQAGGLRSLPFQPLGVPPGLALTPS